MGHNHVIECLVHHSQKCDTVINIDVILSFHSSFIGKGSRQNYDRTKLICDVKHTF